MAAQLAFASDYMEGAHPAILKKLEETNLIKSAGYGLDEYSETAREKIRKACNAPEAEVHFLVGGTQTNATVIGALLASYQGVIAAETGHVSSHEAGAIEAGGHKVLTIPQTGGKISAEKVEEVLNTFKEDGNRDHMVMPGMVYISQPTEYGTLYNRQELEALSKVCHSNGIPLYLDGARLAYALACSVNDVTLEDIAACCDAFYIGGTKCGALFGEAVVFPKPGLIPHFFTIIKQHGALLAKGRILGIQFDVLFENDLYEHIGEPAIAAADKIREGLKENGIELYLDAPTNQVFCVLDNAFMEKLAQKVEFSFWEKKDETHTVIRFATSWATTMEDVDELIKWIKQKKNRN